jgi:penicillin-binding protein 1A
LPAKAWHEFMVAAHEGVPIARLPGTWNGAIAGTDAAPVPPRAVGESAMDAGAATPVSSSRKVAMPEMAGGSTDAGQTASIPRPRAEVGGTPQKKPSSVLDVILGN